MSEKDKEAVRLTAVHEAGHAVIGRRLGLLCSEVSIVPDFEEGVAGFSITKAPDEIWLAWLDQDRVRSKAMVLHGRIMAYMAGQEAQIEILGQAGDGDGDDCWQITEMMLSLLGPGVDGNEEIWDRTEARLRRWTRTLVRRHRAMIERVAEALLARQTLSGEEIDDMMGIVRPEPVPFPYEGSEIERVDLETVDLVSIVARAREAREAG